MGDLLYVTADDKEEIEEVENRGFERVSPYFTGKQVNTGSIKETIDSLKAWKVLDTYAVTPGVRRRPSSRSETCQVGSRDISRASVGAILFFLESPATNLSTQVLIEYS